MTLRAGRAWRGSVAVVRARTRLSRARSTLQVSSRSVCSLKCVDAPFAAQLTSAAHNMAATGHASLFAPALVSTVTSATVTTVSSASSSSSAPIPIVGVSNGPHSGDTSHLAQNFDAKVGNPDRSRRARGVLAWPSFRTSFLRSTPKSPSPPQSVAGTHRAPASVASGGSSSMRPSFFGRRQPKRSSECRSSTALTSSATLADLAAAIERMATIVEQHERTAQFRGAWRESRARLTRSDEENKAIGALTLRRSPADASSH